MASNLIAADTLLVQTREIVLGTDMSPEADKTTPLIKRLHQSLNKPLREMFPRNIFVIAPQVKVQETISLLDENGAYIALVRETPDTILGAVSRNTLEQLIEEDDTLNRQNPAVSAVMARNVSIESDQATVLDVIERITVGGCPIVIVVDVKGEPIMALDAESLKSLIVALPEEFEPLFSGRIH